MRPSMRSPALVLLLFLALAACARERGDTPPGYRGPVPSAEAQAVLRQLEGLAFRDQTGALGGGDWTTGRFGVIPNPVSANGKGPVVTVHRDGAVRHLPVESDGDVADFHRRVRGSPPPGLAGRTSAAYRVFFAIGGDS